MKEHISYAKISFLRPIQITNFLKQSNLRPKYQFLGSIDEYAKYYKKNEKSVDPISISGIDIMGLNNLSLEPMKAKKTLNTFWRSFRMPLWIEERNGDANGCLFNLLPLIIKIPTINHIMANERSLKPSVYAYLFPFGLCVVNMEIVVQNISFAALLELIPYVNKSVIYINNNNNLNFKNFALNFGKELDNAMFQKPGHVQPYNFHTVFFIQSDEALYYDKNLSLGYDHARFIAALMSNSSAIYDVPNDKERLKEILNENIEGTKGGELVFFNKSHGTSLIYPSYLYLRQVSKEKGSKEVTKKINCMFYNNSSFLNVLLAVNSVLSYMTHDSSTIRKSVLDSFNAAFLNNSVITRKRGAYYFKTLFDPLSQELGIVDKLTKLA